MASTKIIRVSVTANEKKQLLKHAKSLNASVSEYLRKCALSQKTSLDEELLEGLINLMNRSTTSACNAIDDALAYVEESNRRIEKMERVS
ncbi:MAG: plasmid mobilization protein [Methylophilus sp.]